MVGAIRGRVLGGPVARRLSAGVGQAAHLPAMFVISILLLIWGVVCLGLLVGLALAARRQAPGSPQPDHESESL